MKNTLNIRIQHLLILICFVICLYMTLQRIPVADTWWMLKSGQVIVESGKIPKNDIFSYTASSPEIPWINHEWLAGIVFFLLYNLGKFPLLYAFKSIVILTSYSLMIYIAWKRTGHSLTSAVLAGIAMILISGGNLYFDIRAYLFTYILLVLTLFILDKAYFDEKPMWLYGLIPVTLIWVNSHGGYILVYILQVMFLLCTLVKRMKKGIGDVILKSVFLMGTGVVLFLKNTPEKALQNIYYGLGFLFVAAGITIILIYIKSRQNKEIENQLKPRQGIIKHGIISLTLTILCGLVNPYTYEIFLYPFTFLGDSFYKRNLIEWIPPDLIGGKLSLLICAILVLIGGVVFSRKLRSTDFLLISMFSYLSLTVVRHSVLYSIALIPVTAVILHETGIFIGRSLPEFPPVIKQAGKISVLLLFILVIVLSLFIFIVPVTSHFPFLASRLPFLMRYRIDYAHLNMERDLFPVAGVKFLKQNDIPGRMYNPYEWGGYFIWKIYPKYKVFIDGRANTVYPEEVYRESLSTMRGDPGWEKVMDKYDINFVFCNKLLRDVNAHLLPDKLEESPRWVLIYEDQIEKVFIKDIPQNRQIIEKAHKGKLNYPITPFSLTGKALECIKENKTFYAEEYLKQALDINPDYLPALSNMGYIYAILGDKKRAVKIFRKILMIDPGYPGANYNLGKLYESDGKVDSAIRHYRAELKSNPGFEPAKKSLETLQKGKNHH